MIGRRYGRRRRNTATHDATPPAPPSQTPPLPSNAIEYWHSELGVTPSVLIAGQIQGYQLFFFSAPTIAPDGVLFGGRDVMQSTTSGGKYFGNGSAFTLFAGSRPYMYVIGRYRTIPSADVWMSETGDHFGFTRFAVGCNAAGNLRGSFEGAFTTDGGADTGVHRFEAWFDGTNRNFRVDGSNTATADASQNVACNAVGIGGSGAVGGSASDSSVAFVLYCAAKPTDPEIAALNAWATAYWGAP